MGKRYSDEDRKRMVEERGYKLLEISREKQKNRMFVFITIKCPKGHKFKMSFEKFYNAGHRCMKCSESKGEREITRILSQYNIKSISQYKFDDCKFKQCLPFDFYLPDYNILIEYDGEQHYKIFDYFGGLDKFVDTKIRDTIKNEYCNKNNIKLIRIPYWDYNKIEDILKCELNL